MLMRGRLALALILSVVAMRPAAAQSIVTSAGPETVSVTVYRAPYRDADEAISRRSPQGYALITETRMIAVPAGKSTIRFEGVAGNIFPESAIVAGLPGGVREKNLDADLLSPRSLYDRALGRRVILQRTDPATGKVREEQATIRSGAAGAAVLQTGAGYEAMRCTGLPETLVYDAVPPGLSAKPTLSIEIDSPVAASTTITLSYLAGGFDWQADYVIQLRPDGQRADLFAWITLASSDVTSFVAAGTQVIAGKPNRESEPSFGNYTASALTLHCWPTGDERRRYFPVSVSAPPPPPPPPPPAMAMEARAESIVVTASRIARQEELGDLKLYRISDPVTVASQAQKQIGLLSKDSVPVAVVYVSDVYGGAADEPERVIRARNRTDAGLGLPLPAGRAIVFEEADGRPMLVDESSIDDKAVGEDVEFKLGSTPSVTAAVESTLMRPRRKNEPERYRLTATNANPWPIAFEAKFERPDGQIRFASRMGKRDGLPLWSVAVPANGTATLDYTIRPDR